MPELMTAKYQDETLCIFDIMDADGHYVEEIRSAYRKASQSGELSCPECGERLELCAGAIVAPYFRHHSIGDCVITKEMATEAGKRKYFNRKFLYSILQEQSVTNITVCERMSEWPMVPIVFESEEGKAAFLYLDGKSRNYKELADAHKYYFGKKILDVWFLDKTYQSHSVNITSDEAEVSRLNHGIIYYLDSQNHTIDLRKKYQDSYGNVAYFTETFPYKSFCFDGKTFRCEEYERDFQEKVYATKREINRVVRIPLDEGIDEAYFDFAYAYMDSISEIWVLPPFKYAEAGGDEKTIADEKRVAFLEQINENIRGESPMIQLVEATKAEERINRERAAWSW